MIIPCIDLQRGKAVQLVRGRRRLLEVDDVLSLLERFRGYPLLHVIDLDAALRRGCNGRLVRALCRSSKARVLVGSAAFRRGRVHHAFLRRLAARVGRRRIILALDTEGGRIVVRGWRVKLRLRAEEVMPQLERYCSGFLCTYVDAEGTMRGTNLAWFHKLRRTTRLPITAAGGIRSRREVRALKRLSMNAAVGVALYLGRLRLTLQ